jgi:hypothetical protein
MYDLCKIKNSNIYNLDFSNKNVLLERFFNKFKVTDIGTIKILNKNYVVKREFFTKNFYLLNILYKLLNLDVNEYKFYKHFEKKIKKYKFQKNIQLPIEYNICKKFNIYLFKKLDIDLNNSFIKNINKNDFLNIFKQTIFITYFINHILGFFHNDISQLNNVRNLMINKIDNKSSYYLKIDNLKTKVKKYQVIMIDFGLYSKTFGFKGHIFYNKKSVRYFYSFPILSEVFIILYLLLKNYVMLKHKKNKKLCKKIDFLQLYLYFYNKIKITKNKKTNLKNFDKCILENINDVFSFTLSP